MTEEAAVLYKVGSIILGQWWRQRGISVNLRKAKERVTLDSATDGCAAKTEDKTPFNRSRNHNKVMNENPIRSNGGHQVVRLLQNAIENMIETFPRKRPLRLRHPLDFINQHTI